MLTGTFTTFNRKEAKAALEALGAKVSGSVAGGAIHLFALPSPGARARVRQGAGLVRFASEARLVTHCAHAPAADQDVEPVGDTVEVELAGGVCEDATVARRPFVLSDLAQRGQ